jgi:hypothetical protein
MYYLSLSKHGLGEPSLPKFLLLYVACIVYQFGWIKCQMFIDKMKDIATHANERQK